MAGIVAVPSFPKIGQSFARSEPVDRVQVEDLRGYRFVFSAPYDATPPQAH